MGIRLQKHEQQAVAAVIAVAGEHGLTAHRGEARNTKHPVNVVIQHGDVRVTLGIPSSPRDRTWCVRVAGKKAKSICRDLLNGLKPPPHQHI